METTALKRTPLFDRHLAAAARLDAEVDDAIDRFVMLAVQGPRAREIVAALAGADLPPRLRAGTVPLAGTKALVCGTGYTGEDGVEILIDPAAGPRLWDELL